MSGLVSNPTARAACSCCSHRQGGTGGEGGRRFMREYLICRAGARLYLELDAVARVATGVGQAQTGLWIAQSAVRLLKPLLAADAVAVVEVDLAARDRAVTADIETSGEGLERILWRVHPMLVDGGRNAIPHLDDGQLPIAVEVVAGDVYTFTAGSIDRVPASHRELLGNGSHAPIDGQHRSIRAVSSGSREAKPGSRIKERSVGLLNPLLPAHAAAVIQLHLGTSRRHVSLDIKAPAEGRY